MAINAGTMTMRAAEKLVELAGLVEFRMIFLALPKRASLILNADQSLTSGIPGFSIPFTSVILSEAPRLACHLDN